MSPTEGDPYRLNLYQFLLDYFTFFSTPTICGFTSMLIRYLPYADPSSSYQVRQDTLEKELLAATSIYWPVQLNYSSIFGSHRERDIPLHTFVACPEVAEAIHRGLREARFTLTNTLLVPKVSTKTIKHDPVSYLPYESSLRTPRPIVTLADIEEVYCRTGHRLAGVTEMRSSWKGNDLKPRVYYARGPDVHFASSVIQRLFNVFVDSIPNVNRRNRFSFADLEMMTPEMTMFIYDYSSFTSTLHEIRHFTAELANFCRGHRTTILDGHLGPVEVDIGDLLDVYNQECNITAEFDASQLLEVVDAVFDHNCGMLGVPGNISSCTLLHGIHLCILIGSMLRSKVIGDDALGIIVFSVTFTKQDLLDALSSIGQIAFDKMEFWEDRDTGDHNRWNYEKRPLERQNEVMFKGTLMTWPSINVLEGIINPEHRPLHYSPAKEFRVACRQLARFQTQLFHLTLSPLEKELILRLIRRFYSRHDLKCHDLGYLGEIFRYGEVVNVLIPPCSDNFFNLSLKNIMRSHPGSWIWLPLSDHDVLQAYTLEVGSSFEAYPDSILSYLRGMDFLGSSRLQQRVLMTDILDETLDLYLLGRLRFSYTYDILDHLPAWCLPYLDQFTLHV